MLLQDAGPRPTPGKIARFIFPAAGGGDAEMLVQ